MPVLVYTDGNSSEDMDYGGRFCCAKVLQVDTEQEDHVHWMLQGD